MFLEEAGLDYTIQLVDISAGDQRGWSCEHNEIIARRGGAR
jgi:hypothetical protein